MPQAVPQLFGSSSSLSQAPGRTSSLSAPGEGFSSFQDILSQTSARSSAPAFSAPPAPLNTPPAPLDRSSATDKRDRSSRSSNSGNHRGRIEDDSNDSNERSEKPSAKKPGDPSDAATSDTVANTDEAENDHATAEHGKTKEKRKGDDATASDAQPAPKPDNPVEVKPVKPADQENPKSGKDKSRGAKVKAVSADSEDSTVVGPDSTGDAQAAAVLQATAGAGNGSAPATLGKPAVSDKQSLAVQPRGEQPGGANPAAATPSAAQAAVAVPSDLSADSEASAPGKSRADAPVTIASPDVSATGAFADLLSSAQAAGSQPSGSSSAHQTQAANTAPTLPPEIQFAQDNHAQIASEIRGQLLPAGGTMQIRLDPPELGAVQVIVRVHEGVMSASFETSNDNATQMLSHSLGQLKTALEAQGVTVGKIHVQQAPRDQQTGSRDQHHENSDPGAQDHPAQREQQRREMLRRMWRRLSGGNDPLDLVA